MGVIKTKRMKSIKEKAHEIGWVYSKNYDPIACKQEWCEMAAREGANYVLTEILDKTSKCITIKDAYEAFLECVEQLKK